MAINQILSIEERNIIINSILNTIKQVGITETTPPYNNNNREKYSKVLPHYSVTVYLVDESPAPQPPETYIIVDEHFGRPHHLAIYCSAEYYGMEDSGIKATYRGSSTGLISVILYEIGTDGEERNMTPIQIDTKEKIIFDNDLNTVKKALEALVVQEPTVILKRREN